MYPGIFPVADPFSFSRLKSEMERSDLNVPRNFLFVRSLRGKLMNLPLPVITVLNSDKFETLGTRSV